MLTGKSNTDYDVKVHNAGGYMITKKRITVCISPDVHKKATTILKASGIKFSSYVEIITKSLIDSEEKSFKAMCEDMTGAFMNEAVKIGKPKKR